MGIAVVPRFVDSRAYAGIYATLGEEMMEAAEGAGTSTRTARLGMLKEVVGFFENSLPELIINVSDWWRHAGRCDVEPPRLRRMSGGRHRHRDALRPHRQADDPYNEGLNDEHERQVDAVHSSDPRRLGEHLRAMMRWNIRLSDLEATNFGINWVFMIARWSSP